jgi:CheY-like chemotaxis protein
VPPAAAPPAAPRAAAPDAAPGAAAARPVLMLLRHEHVEPLDAPGEGAPVEGPHAPAPGPPPDPAPAPAQRPTWAGSPFARPRAAAPSPQDPAAGGHGRRAIVAEDSFMARIFLMRLLQQSGYDVHSVGTARELREALADATWALVCVDVELPDARGAAWIREVMDAQDQRPEPAVVVALVRDGRDQREAAAGGVHRTLLKPFAQRDVAALLERAGLPGGPR